MRRSAPGRREHFDGKHRFEHWYRDNSIYFITARCRDKTPAFDSEEARQIYWDRARHWQSQFGFVPIVSSLMNSHYHEIGYLKTGANLGPMMRRIHGSVAKLVNDTLDERLVPFWRDSESKDYFDGFIRDELQFRRAYRYVMTQSVRHRICKHWRDYPHTRVNVELEPALCRALELKCFLPMVPYQRYQRGRHRH